MDVFCHPPKDLMGAQQVEPCGYYMLSEYRRRRDKDMSSGNEWKYGDGAATIIVICRHGRDRSRHGVRQVRSLEVDGDRSL